MATKRPKRVKRPHVKPKKRAPRKDPPHVGIIYEGPSPHDGSPIVAIGTADSRNAKTGKSLTQVWIIRSDMNPVHAKECGADCAICGHCPMRKACYVQVSKAPLSVYEKYARGGYKHITPEALAGRKIRWGAYGDPAMLPLDLVLAVNAVAAGYVGYTHQHSTPHGRRFAGVFMASVETPKQEATLRARGWTGTFRAGRRDGSDRGDARLCANEASGVKCEDCMECDGKSGAIFIGSHGSLAKYAVAEWKASAEKKVNDAKRRLPKAA